MRDAMEKVQGLAPRPNNRHVDQNSKSVLAHSEEEQVQKMRKVRVRQIP